MGKPKPKRRRRSNARQVPSRNSPSSANSTSRVQHAIALHSQGNLQAAKDTLCGVIEQDPLNADAWHILGMTLLSAGQAEEALNCLTQANSMVPEHPEVLANLGIVYRALGDLQTARRCLEKSTKLDPLSAAAHNSLGTIFLELDRIDEAERQYQTALKLNPNLPGVEMNLGNLWQQQGRVRDAEQLYRRLLERASDDPGLKTNLAEALRQQRHLDEATELLTSVLRVHPAMTEAVICLGRTLQLAFRHEEAERVLRNLILQEPENAKAYQYLGELLFELGDLDAATTEINHALSLDPKNSFALSLLGFVQTDRGELADAAKSFSRAMELAPDRSDVHGALLYLQSCDPTIDPDRLFQLHREWGDRHGNAESVGEHRNSKEPDRRIRIGYVSPDFCRHVVSSYILPVLQCHNADEVEIHCYAEVAVPDSTTDRLRQLAHHWRYTTGLSDDQVARQILDDKIDILIDLAGHTARNRLHVFARRPAPIQMTWLGYPNTTGLSSIDYRLTCATQNPHDEPSRHVEELVRMEGGSFCYSPPRQSPAVTPPPLCSKGFVTLGSLHRPVKISDSVRDLWAEVMREIPDSKLLIFHTRFTQQSMDELREGLVGRGMDEDRFEIRNEYHAESYLEVYREIDIGLDVSPWGGGTTTLEALWMGVPVVARYGKSRASRSTSAIVTHVGHPEWNAMTDQEYVECVRRLASDPQSLNETRSVLRQQLSETIADASRFTGQLERTYRSLWRNWCET